MATNTSVCSICDLRHLTSSSKYWCPECEEALCSECLEHHSLSRATRGHTTIPIAQYHSLPTFVTDIQQFCIYHNEKYQQYCMKHESPICYKCIKEHGKCSEVIPLEDIISEVKSSELFRDLEQRLKDGLGNIKRIRKDREDNFKTFQTQKKKITNEIDYIRMQIIQYLDKLKKDFIKELEQTQHTFHVHNESIISSLKDQEKDMDKYSTEIGIMKKHASDLQTFLGMTTIKSKIIENEKCLQSMIGNKSLEQVSIHMSIDEKILDILTAVKKFGSIIVQESPSPSTIILSKKTKQAQIALSKIMPSINTISVYFKQKLDTTSSSLMGCLITRTGGYLFTDYSDPNDRLIALDIEGKTDYIIQLPVQYCTFDVELLDDDTVAVTTGKKMKNRQRTGIIIVDLQTRKVIEFIPLPICPYGITYDGKSLICCVQHQDLRLISCTNYRITTIPNTALPTNSYVSTHADKIYFTNPEKHKVSCCLYNGTLVWEFKEETILKEPRGITTDDNGNIFVVCRESCNVLILSPDGKQYKQILNKDNGLNAPSTVFFHKIRKQLLVTNSSKIAHLYDIS
ncbi:uncharacterized protein LOC134684140 [Mytilus trossulus]|uniref:uncharacterized protein LOC134684140 n=1 Tax=Mytilus trossulus TaxID=6551 RepID=UPI003004FA9B